VSVAWRFGLGAKNKLAAKNILSRDTFND